MRDIWKKVLKNYRVNLDVWAILLFLAIMLPNFVWFFIPAPNDVLRAESVTQILDSIASVCQVLFVTLLVLVQRKDAFEDRCFLGIVSTVLWLVVYLVTWLFYYSGSVNAVIIILLCVTPCLSFGSYALDRKNVIAVIPLIIFSVCHLLYGILNFICYGCSL